MLKGGQAVFQCARIFYDDHSVGPEAFVFVLHVLQLTVDDERDEQQAYGNGELEGDQAIAEQRFVAARPGGRADDQTRPETGEVEGGVDSCQQTHGEGEKDQPGVVDGQEGDGAGEGAAGKPGITEKDELDEAACQDHGQGAEQQGFFKDLADQVPPGGAERLFQSYLFNADRRSGCDEVDVVYHGQGDEQDADGAEQPNLGKVAAGGEIEFQVRMEVDTRQRLDDKGDV